MPTSAWSSFTTISSAKCRFCGIVSLLQIGNARIVENRSGDRAAKIEVEPAPVSLVVGNGEAV
jgi:hypothetical protein